MVARVQPRSSHAPFWARASENASLGGLRMRKSLWIMLAFLMVAAMVAPSVRADSVTFVCNGDNI